MISVVIPTWNLHSLLKQTIDSLFKCAGGKWELIVIDNASTDGTKAYLETLEKEQGNVRVIYNKENLGFVRANNQGILLAQGEYILLANNDLIFTPDFMLKLKRCLEQHPECGMVGPYSNFVSGRQYVQVNVKNAKEANNFVANFSMKEQVVDRLVFFCVLIRAELFRKDSCGLLDDDFSPGNFEDDYMCWLVRKTGRSLRIANVFVWHVGSASFKKDLVAFGRLLGRNQKIFYHKTGREIRISLCMVVGDYEKPETLKRCLDSIVPFVDEVCINFTYRKFLNQKLIKKLLQITPLDDFSLPENWDVKVILKDSPCPVAVIYKYEKWRWDFAYHRNQAQKLATGQWIVYMDASDTYDSGLLLRQCVVENDVIADYQTANVYAPSEDGVVTHLLHVRLFRNKPEHEWRKPIHEDILLSIKEHQGRSAKTDLVFTHHGYKTIGSTYAKNRRNLVIMKRHVINNPNADSLDLYHLANTYILLACQLRKNRDRISKARCWKFLQKALVVIDRCIALPLLETDPLWPKMVFMKARIYHEIGNFDEAKIWYMLTIEKQDYIESHLGISEILITQRNYDAALGHLQAMLKQGLATGITVTSVPKNLQELEEGMWYNLGLCYFNREEYKLAKEAFQRCLMINKYRLLAVDFLCDCLRREGQTAMAFQITLQACNMMPFYANGFNNLGAFELLNKRYVTARIFLQQALKIDSRHQLARKNLAMIVKK